MQRDRRSPSTPNPPIWFGLRPRLLGALVLTAIVTLATAALTLLAPLQSRLKSDIVNLTQTEIGAAKTLLGTSPLHGSGPASRGPDIGTLQTRARQIHRNYEVAVVVWSRAGGAVHEVANFNPDRDISKSLAMIAFADAHNGVHHVEDSGVLEVASRFNDNGYRFVVELSKPLNYVGEANSVVRSAFLTAALVGLAVAVLVGIGFSSRLLRRLRLLRDASRSLDERELSTLAVPEDRVSDEIGELAQAFATMHARLRLQEDARRAFVATASHELRTPLTSLDGMLELLADDLATDPIDVDDARERVAQAQLQSRRLASLANDLLDLSRIDAQVPLRSEPVELGETARAVTAEFDQRAHERNVAVVLDQIGDAAWARADPGSVARIVRILLDNALAAAPPDTMIEVRIRNGTGPQTIEVADQGPGVPDSERELIFERFKRGTGRGSEGGFGLGLAIGSELASRMGGALELTDARPGATFRLTLPEAGS